jgi:hypothetical protein
MIRALGLAAAVAALALAAARAEETPDVPAGDATLRGRLVSQGGAQVGDALVILYSLSAKGEAGLRSTRSDAKGEFAFEKIAADPAIVYLVGTRVGGVPYGARATFAPGEHEHRIEVAIAEPTQDPASLVRGDARLRIERGCTHVRVQQSQALDNPSSRVIYVPPEQRASAKPLLQIELPEGAEGFEAVETAGAESLEQNGRSVRFWGPLHPGHHEIEWAFGLAQDDPVSLQLGFPDGARSVQLLAPPGSKVLGGGLAAQGERSLPIGRHAVFASSRIAPGGALDATIELPAPPDGPRPRIDEARLWLELDDVALDVSEQWTLKVDGDQALVSEGGPLLCVPLPQGAQDLRFSTGALGMGLSRDPSGALALSGPIPPGETPLALRYRLASGGGATSLTRRFGSEVPLLQVFVADTGLRADSPRMHRKRPVVTEDRVYLELEAFAVEPHEDVTVSLEPLPAHRAPARALALGVVVLGALGAGAFLLAPLRGGPPRSEPAAEAVEGSERESLYRAIDALDEDLETEKLSPEDHAQMRAALRARAVELLAREQAPRSEPAPEPAPLVSARKFCTSCGAALRATDRFCSQCGTRQDAREDAAS